MSKKYKIITVDVDNDNPLCELEQLVNEFIKKNNEFVTVGRATRLVDHVTQTLVHVSVVGNGS